MGRWSWYNNYGSEEQVLAEMIADELDYEVMGKAYSKLQVCDKGRERERRGMRLSCTNFIL